MQLKPNGWEFVMSAGHGADLDLCSSAATGSIMTGPAALVSINIIIIIIIL